MKYYIKKVISKRISKRGVGFVDIEMVVENEQRKTQTITATFSRKQWEEVHRIGQFEN